MLTQKELALRSGVAPHTISAIECDSQKPRLSTLVALAKALGVSGADFYDEFDERAC